MLTNSLSPAGADLVELEEDVDEAPLEVAPDRRRVITDKQDVPVDTLYSRVKKGIIDLQPDFQRNFVWNAAKASRLIESLLLDIPIPIIYVAEESDGTWSVVDGQQRLTSICSFLDGKFPDNRDFRLSSLQVLVELNGKSFDTLDLETQRKIESTALRLIVIKKESDPDVKFEVFERLNLGAERLNDQELRNSVYRGPYNDLLRKLSSNPYMLKIMGLSTPHNRMHDRQLILRFFAMRRNSHLNYRSPIKRFLNQEMEAHRQDSPKALAELESLFEASIEMAWHVFGPHAFRRYTPGMSKESPNGVWEKNRLNVALWDTLLYGLSFHKKSQVIPRADAVLEEFLDLMTNDATFVEYTIATTDKPERVRYRAEVWLQRLRAVLGEFEAEPRSFTHALKRELFQASPVCEICGQQIKHVDDAEVDHIQHYWRGGKTIPENARLTHRYCNRVRGGS